MCMKSHATLWPILASLVSNCEAGLVTWHGASPFVLGTPSCAVTKHSGTLSTYVANP